jgi:hypothetical protein
MAGGRYGCLKPPKDIDEDFRLFTCVPAHDIGGSSNLIAVPCRSTSIQETRESVYSHVFRNYVSRNKTMPGGRTGFAASHAGRLRNSRSSFESLHRDAACEGPITVPLHVPAMAEQ